MKDMNAPKCERENDLIGFLYGELDETETPAFERHLHQCASCSADLAGFNGVRESVISWRNESLSFAPSAAANVRAVQASGRKPSAIAALREFFSLSPLWMKGAVAFATLALCLLAGLTIARWQTRAVPVAINDGYTKEQVEAMIAQRVQEDRDNRQKQSQPPPEDSVIAREPVAQNPPKPAPRRQVIAKQGQHAYAKRPLSKTERAQLAADLRLLSSSDGDIDLLSDSINQ